MLSIDEIRKYLMNQKYKNGFWNKFIEKFVVW